MIDWNARSFHGTSNKYPFTEVVSFVMRAYGASDARSAVRVLDLGCGGGAHMAFLAAEGFDVYGIDGNEASVVAANKRMSSMGFADDRATAGHFEQMKYADEMFDLVIDRGSITCNAAELLPGLFAEVRRVLKPNGRVFCMMLDLLGAPAAGGRSAGHGNFVDFSDRLSGAKLLNFTTPVALSRVLTGYRIDSLERLVRYAEYPAETLGVTEAWTIAVASKT